MRTYPTLNRGKGGVITASSDWKLFLRGWCRIFSTHRLNVSIFAECVVLFANGWFRRAVKRHIDFCVGFGARTAVTFAQALVQMLAQALVQMLTEAFLQTLVQGFVQWLAQAFVQALAQTRGRALARSCSCRRRRRSCKHSLRRSHTGARVDSAGACASAR